MAFARSRFGAKGAPETSPPAFLAHVWVWWLELHRRRTRGFGVCPLSFPEIAHWSVLSGACATPFEVGLIVQIDNAFIEWADGDQTTAPEPSSPLPTRPMTEDLFDAMFA
ncbi:phage tail assembly chaperone [Kaistia soli]|uniref:phage tail assembly chaperone n=1 Tax=Kaistia soli TaxID=446684 RepID=UPI003CC7EA03